MITDLPDHDHRRRIDALRLELAGRDLVALIVTDLVNVRWLTGFTGSNALCLMQGEHVTLITDSRYEIQAAEQVPAEVEVVIAGTGPGDQPGDHLGARIDTDRVGFEADHLTVHRLAELKEQYETASSAGSDWVATDGVIARLRQRKDQAEIARLAAACQIADQALAAMGPWLRPGVTERRAARQLEWEMAERGSERPSFPTILASGPNGAKPHARPSDRLLEQGDLVVIDFGATVDGYGSDMTRSFAIGAPTADQSAWYDRVAEAQAAGVSAIQLGAELRSIDTVTRSHLAASGQAGVYAHGTGHGVGLFIHERPILSPRVEGAVEDGMTLTVEPGAYVPGVGGIRVEDLVVATVDGPAVLTRSPKGLHPPADP